MEGELRNIKRPTLLFSSPCRNFVAIPTPPPLKMGKIVKKKKINGGFVRVSCFKPI